MSRAMSAMARLAKVRQDMAMAKARRIASEFAKAKDLNEQVINYANEYGNAAMQMGQKGVSVAMLNDTMAFRTKLLAGASEQELATAQMHKQLKLANQQALAAKLKSQGLDRAVARRKKEAEQKLQQAEWQSIEDSFSHRKSPFSSQK